MKDFFHQRGLKRTAVREAILEILQRAVGAMDVEAIYEKLQQRFDRATVYRTMKVLEEGGFVHRVISQQKMYYAAGGEATRHAHFHCSSCGRVECMDAVTADFTYHFPEGYQVHDMAVLFFGVCKCCNNS